MKYLLLVALTLLFVCFAYGETTVLGSNNSMRRIARRTRKLVRDIDHRASGRRLHKRTRTMLNKLFKRVHKNVKIITVRHSNARTIAERKKWTQLLVLVARRLSSIHKRLNTTQFEKLVVQPKINIKGHVNLNQIRQAYLTKMRAAIKHLASRYKKIIKRIEDSHRDTRGKKGDLKKRLRALRTKSRQLRAKLQIVRKQYKDAQNQIKREKRETSRLRGIIRKLKAQALKSVKKMRKMIRRLRRSHKRLANRAKLVRRIKRLRGQIRRVHRGLRYRLNKHKKALYRKIRSLHEQWDKKREALEDAWRSKRRLMQSAWDKERRNFKDQIERLTRRTKECGKGRIWNVRIKRCVSQKKSTDPSGPERVNPGKKPAAPKPARSNRLDQFNNSLKKTKQSIQKMNAAIKKMAEKERN